jgi:hypothetical protein
MWVLGRIVQIAALPVLNRGKQLLSDARNVSVTITRGTYCKPFSNRVKTLCCIGITPGLDEDIERNAVLIGLWPAMTKVVGESATAAP